MTAKLSLYIDAPVKRVFDFMTDPHNWVTPEEPGGLDVTVTEIHKTKEGSGSYFVWVWKVAGIPVHGFAVNTDVVADERFTHRESLSMLGTVTYRFEPEGTGTRMNVERHPGWFWRLPLVSVLPDRYWVRNVEKATSAWKRRIEEQVTAASAKRPVGAAR